MPLQDRGCIVTLYERAMLRGVASMIRLLILIAERINRRDGGTTQREERALSDYEATAERLDSIGKRGE